MLAKKTSSKTPADKDVEKQSIASKSKDDDMTLGIDNKAGK